MYSTNTRAASMTPAELRQRLAALNMTHADFAALVGVDERTVRRWVAEDGQKTAQMAPPYVRTVLDLHARHKDAQSLFKKRG
jgi:DNA-binding transcriptional regulator YiaG